MRIAKHRYACFEQLLVDRSLKFRCRPSKFPEVEEEMVKWLVECTQSKIIFTDTMIRLKAREVAKILNISEEKFKASSGWIENFKHRHGIRAGVWSGDGKNNSTARALGSGEAEEPADPPVPPLNPAFDRRSDNMDEVESVTPASYAEDEDLPLEDSPESEPDQDMLHSRESSGSGQMVSPPMSMRPAWAIDMASNHPLHQHSSTSSSPDGPHWSAPETMSLPPAVAPVQNDHLPNHQTSTPYDPPAVYEDQQLIYEPPLPDHSIPTVTEAEHAIDRLMIFLDSTGHGLIPAEERIVLTNIKSALFQAASNLPFDRNRH